jgi:hypothetical protein
MEYNMVVKKKWLLIIYFLEKSVRFLFLLFYDNFILTFINWCYILFIERDDFLWIK